MSKVVLKKYTKQIVSISEELWNYLFDCDVVNTKYNRQSINIIGDSIDRYNEYLIKGVEKYGSKSTFPNGNYLQIQNVPNNLEYYKIIFVGDFEMIQLNKYLILHDTILNTEYNYSDSERLVFLRNLCNNLFNV